MGLWTDIVGSVRGYIRLGLTGVRLKNSSGALAVRNAGDSADANIECASVVCSGTQTFRDNKFEITDDSDTTKKLAFQCSGIDTGTTQTIDAATVSQAVAEAGTDTTPRMWTAERVAQAIAALGSGAGMPALTVVSGTTQAASAGNHYALSNASASTVTLPASPTGGDVVVVTVCNGRTDNVIDRNGNKINGVAENMTIDAAYGSVWLRYVDGTLQWRTW